ncbi:MAG: PspA/IM30 family protein, partial [Cyanobacteriota bacterium]|nr:PspA/IM30 family protein [Cyanobacteriota bacterium]
GSDLESQFAQLEAGSDVDDELLAMKAQLSGGSVSQPALEASKTPAEEPVDAELEELRSQLKDL